MALSKTAVRYAAGKFNTDAELKFYYWLCEEVDPKIVKWLDRIVFIVKDQSWW